MIQCHILREPIGKSSAAAAFFGSSRYVFNMKLGPAGGKNKDFAGGQSDAQSLKLRHLP
jgi:hypothetical protein